MISTNNLTRRKTSKIADQFRGEFAGRDKGLFLLAVSTGSRMTELLVLTIGDVFHNGKPADVLLFNRSGEVSKEVPVSKDCKIAIQLLIDWHVNRYGNVDRQRPLFPSRNGGGNMAMSVPRANKVLSEALMAAGCNRNAPNRVLFVKAFLINLLKFARWVKFFFDCL